MRVRYVLIGLRAVTAVPLVLLLSRLLLSIKPIAELAPMGIPAGRLIPILLALLVLYLIFEGRSIGRLATLVYFAYFAYLVVLVSPFLHTAFPRSQSGFVKLVSDYLLMAPREAFLSMPLLLVVSIADDYLLALYRWNLTMEGFGIPESDLWETTYPQVITMALALVLSLVLFTWSLGYLKNLHFNLGGNYLVPVLLILALGASIALGLSEREKVRKTVVVIKTVVPLGKGSTYRLEWGEDALLEVTPGKFPVERELFITADVEKPPKFIRLVVGDKRRVLRRVKESHDNGVRFVLYSDLKPKEM